MIFTVQEFARHVGVSRQYVQRMLKQGRIEGAVWHEGFQRWQFPPEAKIKPSVRDFDVVEGIRGYLQSASLTHGQKAALVALWMIYVKDTKGTMSQLRKHLATKYGDKMDALFGEAKPALDGIKVRMRDFLELTKVFR